MVNITFIGGAHLDRMGKLDGEAVMSASNPGKTVVAPGGAGLNSASVCAMLDVSASVVGPIGDDSEGRIIKQALAERGIKDGLIEIKGGVTGSYFSIVNADGDLIIALADLTLNEQMTETWLFEHCEKHLSQADYWFLSANLSRSNINDIVARSNKGVKIAATTISVRKAIRLRGVLDRLEVLFTNRAEAQSLLRCEDDDCERLASLLVERGVKSGIVSNGSATLSYWQDGKVELLKVKPLDSIVDVTGAGDALAGVVIAGFGKGMAFGDAVSCGVIAAQKTIKMNSPVLRQLSWQELQIVEDIDAG